MLLAWRRLASTPAEKLLTEASIGTVLDDLGFRRDDDAVSDLADDLRQLSGGIGVVGMLTGAFTAAERYGFSRAFGCWLADALLAQRLSWAHAVPLLGAEAALATSARPRRSAASSVATGIETDPERAKSLPLRRVPRCARLIFRLNLSAAPTGCLPSRRNSEPRRRTLSTSSCPTMRSLPRKRSPA
jgi:hypothetical protein